MAQIESKDNQYLRLVRELSKKKYREEYGMFVAEGKRLVADLIDSGLSPHIFLYSEALKDIAFLEQYAGLCDRCFSVKEHLFHQLADTQNEQGIMTVFPRFCPELKQFTLKENGFILILNRITDPGNLGTIVRSAAAAGCDGILLEKGCVDLYNPKVIRATMGTVAKIPIFENLEFTEITDFITRQNIHAYIADMNKAKPYDALSVNEKTAVILGNEGNGIDEHWRSLGFDGVYIPMSNGVESLNVAMAAGIIAFEHQRKVINNLK